MNAAQSTFSQQNNSLFGNQSRIDLRGLGANQTLILVNGRRLPSVSVGSTFEQPDINGIPMSSIERIEVLPATAAGIYGGGATGGAINIVLKRDYSGVELVAGFDNTFDTHVPQYRVEGSAGFSLEGGRTNVMMTASYSEVEELLVGDRDFARRGRDLLFANNPDAFFASPFQLPSGYTTNIRSADGSDLVLDDGTSLGSPFTFVPIGYEGAASDGGAAFLPNAGNYNLDLSDDLGGARATLLNGPRVRSFSLTMRRDFADWLEIFTDASLYDNEGRGTTGAPLGSGVAADTPTNPFTTQIVISSPLPGFALPRLSETETISASVGGNFDISDNWAGQLEYGWSESTTETATYIAALRSDVWGPAVFSTGEVNLLRDVNEFPVDLSPYLFDGPNEVAGPYAVQLRTLSLRLSGPAIKLPAGSVHVAALVERRREDREDGFQDLVGPGFLPDGSFSFEVPESRLFPALKQEVDSVYLEALIPVVSSQNARRGIKELEFQIAMRHDSYSTTAPRDFTFPSLPSRNSPIPDIEKRTAHADSTDYTIGLRYVPVEDIQFRMSFGTGFLPPSLDQIPQLSFTSSSLGSRLVDPRRGGVAGTNTLPIDWTILGSPNLGPEESESVSAGIILTPRFLPGLRISADYTQIEKTDEISNALNTSNIFDFEDQFPSRITRAPLTPEDEALGYTGGEIIALNTTLVNIARSKIEAYDVQINYDWKTGRLGQFRAYVVATYQTMLESQILSTSPVVDRVGFSNGPLQWRGNFGLSWDRGPWTFGWNTQFYDSYLVYSSTAPESVIDQDVLNQGSDTIPSQTYHDAYVRLRIGESSRFGSSFSNTEIRVGIQNVFDEDPPIVASLSGTEGYSTYGDPRLRRYSIQIQKRF